MQGDGAIVATAAIRGKLGHCFVISSCCDQVAATLPLFFVTLSRWRNSYLALDASADNVLVFQSSDQVRSGPRPTETVLIVGMAGLPLSAYIRILMSYYHVCLRGQLHLSWI